MIAEHPHDPYLYIGGIESDAGVLIRWLETGSKTNNAWVPYADFEREKLTTLCTRISYHPHCAFAATPYHHLYFADALIGYTTEQYDADSESSRLLKRAEFLKAVCAREGLEWLATAKPATGGVVTEPVPVPDTCCVVPTPSIDDHSNEKQIKVANPQDRGNPDRALCLSCPDCGMYMRLDYYESKHRLECDGGREYFMKEKEKEWRRALLDYLDQSHPTQEQLEDLRHRFT